MAQRYNNNNNNQPRQSNRFAVSPSDIITCSQCGDPRIKREFSRYNRPYFVQVAADNTTSRSTFHSCAVYRDNQANNAEAELAELETREYEARLESRAIAAQSVPVRQITTQMTMEAFLDLLAQQDPYTIFRALTPAQKSQLLSLLNEDDLERLEAERKQRVTMETAHETLIDQIIAVPDEQIAARRGALSQHLMNSLVLPVAEKHVDPITCAHGVSLDDVCLGCAQAVANATPAPGKATAVSDVKPVEKPAIVAANAAAKSGKPQPKRANFKCNKCTCSFDAELKAGGYRCITTGCLSPMVITKVYS